MEYFYEIAGICIRVSGFDDCMYSDHGVLEPFRVHGRLDYIHSFCFSLVDTLAPEEGECIYQDGSKRVYRTADAFVRYVGSTDYTHMRIHRQGSVSQIQCLSSSYPDGITPKTVLNAMEGEHLFTQNHAVILHASFIQVNKKAILFTAPSGTGKSTQAALWCRHRGAELINGDRTALALDGDQVYACGIPFSGSSGVAKNAKLPLAAIVYLSQAAENRVEVLRGISAFRKVWEGISVNTWDRSDLDLASDRLLKVLEKVPVFHLSCRPDEDAVNLLHFHLNEKGGL